MTRSTVLLARVEQIARRPARLLEPHNQTAMVYYIQVQERRVFRSDDRKLPSGINVIDNPLPLHPGKVLAEVYMAEMGLNQTNLANRCGCSHRKINEIVNGKRGISPAFAIVLEAEIGTSAEMWVRLQAEYDLWQARQEVA